MTASPTPTPEPTGLSRDALVTRAGVDGPMVDRLVDCGILSPREGPEPFGPGDAHRIRLIVACERAGMAPEAIGKAIGEGKISLSFMDLPHYRWAGLTSTTYRELAEQLDVPVDVALDVGHMLGSARREPDDRIREDELEVFPLIRLAATVLDHDALMRTARVYADSLRRIVDAEHALWEKHILGAFLRQGMSFRDALEMANQFGSESTELQERMLIAGYRRFQEQRWTEDGVEQLEGVLEEMGLYERMERPPAFAFLDMAGYTRLTEERGDEAGARLAADLGHMVDEVATEVGGEAIKWLGDGVMLHFRHPSEAVAATLDMVDRAPELGLPAHAGIAAGPVVFQDGDYYGRTVNLAARIAAVAEGGQTLVSREVVGAAAGDDYGFHEMGAVQLKGFSTPVAVFEATRAR